MKYTLRKPKKNEKFQTFRGENLPVNPTDVILEREDGRAVPCPKEIFESIFDTISEDKQKNTKTLKKRRK